MSMHAVAPIETASPAQVRAECKAGEYQSWGRFPKLSHKEVHRVYWADQVPQILGKATPAGVLPYGLGRSYGDSCLSGGRALIDCSQLNRFLAFDPTAGRLACEAGVTLADIVSLVLPKGWFLPVTPGTKCVTVGGAIANDVHGKNHHRAGCFGSHVLKMTICRSDAGIVEASRSCNNDLFRAVIGGLGIAGVILAAELQLKRVPGNHMEVEAIPFESLAAFIELSEESDRQFEYTVSWIDCQRPDLRGIFLRGNHRPGFELFRPAKSGPKVPFVMPEALLNPIAVKLFNRFYYLWKKWASRKSQATIDSFFYPLDALQNWNLIYGDSGFVQYQCVLPEAATAELERVLRLVSQAGLGSFLGVLKRFGPAPAAGMMSFARPGLTLALDFPIRRGTLDLLRRLDEIVAACGGALYPAKDARMGPAMFELSFPRWRDFAAYADPKLSSSFWRRVTGEEE